MKCPKCESEDTREGRDTSSSIAKAYNACMTCGCEWTLWQQHEISKLREGLKLIQRFVPNQERGISGKEIHNLIDALLKGGE